MAEDGCGVGEGLGEFLHVRCGEVFVHLFVDSDVLEGVYEDVLPSWV